MVGAPPPSDDLHLIRVCERCGSETSLQILLRWDNDGNDASCEDDHAYGCDDGGGGCDGDSIGNDYAV